jgi:hypothetical protein
MSTWILQVVLLSDDDAVFLLCWSFLFLTFSWFWLPFSFSRHDTKSPFILEKKLHFFSWNL